MELRHLRYFIAAAEHEHFGRAVAALGIVQPALSKQMRELEAETGLILFERAGRGLRLSEAGRDYLVQAKQLLASLDRAGEQARMIQKGRRGLLRIGFVDTALYAPLLPGLLQRHRRLRPEVRLELQEGPSLLSVDRLREGRLDLAFVYHVPEDKMLEHTVVLRDSIVLAVPDSHPLSGRKSIQLGAVRNEDFVWIQRSLSPPFYDLVLTACENHGFEPHVVQESGSDNSLLSLVVAGVGLTFSLASTRHRQPRGLSLVRLPELDGTLSLKAVWRRGSSNPALTGFLSLVRGKDLRGGD